MWLPFGDPLGGGGSVGGVRLNRTSRRCLRLRRVSLGLAVGDRCHAPARSLVRLTGSVVGDLTGHVTEHGVVDGALVSHAQTSRTIRREWIVVRNWNRTICGRFTSGLLFGIVDATYLKSTPATVVPAAAHSRAHAICAIRNASPASSCQHSMRTFCSVTTRSTGRAPPVADTRMLPAGASSP